MIQFHENTNAITFAIENEDVDVLAHSCNCFCIQGGGIAKSINEIFKTTSYSMEHPNRRGDYSKLGNIEVMPHMLPNRKKDLDVANMYGQYDLGQPSPFSDIPLDYSALFLCLQKLFKAYEGKVIVIPAKIGCGLAGGNWDIVLEFIEKIEKHLKNTTIHICQF